MKSLFRGTTKYLSFLSIQRGGKPILMTPYFIVYGRPPDSIIQDSGFLHRRCAQALDKGPLVHLEAQSAQSFCHFIGRFFLFATKWLARFLFVLGGYAFRRLDCRLSVSGRQTV